MEERKLIRLGNSSFAIALPKNWITKSNLKKGDKVFLVPNSNGEIIVSPEFKKGNDGKEITLDLTKKSEREIARDFISAYISGNKIIQAIGQKQEIKLAKNKAKNFLNLELIDEKEGKAIFKDLLDIENIEIKNLIKRMDNNTKEIFNLLLSYKNAKKISKENVKEIEEIDKDITKFYFLIWRLMNLGIDNPSLQSNLKINPSSFVNYFWMSYNLEQIGDELKRIPEIIAKTEVRSELFFTIIKKIKDVYDQSMKSFFEKKKELSREALLKKEEIMKSCDKLSNIRNFEIIAEKLKQINMSIHNNSKMIFYEL